MKCFTDADLSLAGGKYDVENGTLKDQWPRISCLKTDLVDDQPDWMKLGLQQTASGYGRKLNSGWKIHFNGKLYRIYTTIFSNNGTCWFVSKGKRIVVNAH